MKQTVLYDKHIALKAKMAPFGGYLMPIQYEGIIKEHMAARTNVAVFDTCHMGEFYITGKTALEDLERLLTCRIGNLTAGQCKYGFICNEHGGVIDDQITCRLTEEAFFMVVNASTEPADFDWIQEHLSSSTDIENRTAVTGKLDIQGPGSPKIMNKLLEKPVNDLKYYTFMQNRYNGKDVLVSRTGYTGEIGFEVYSTTEETRNLWDDCLNEGVTPAGLGARDTLRLEMGYPLYGHELDIHTNAAESGFTRAIAQDKQFIGSAAVRDPSRRKRILVGIELEGRRAARNGDPIVDSAGKAAGTVTSGSFSPSLSKALALAYVDIHAGVVGTSLVIKTERQDLTGKIVDLPFYKKATGRADIRIFI